MPEAKTSAADSTPSANVASDPAATPIEIFNTASAALTPMPAKAILRASE